VACRLGPRIGGDGGGTRPVLTLEYESQSSDEPKLIELIEMIAITPRTPA